VGVKCILFLFAFSFIEKYTSEQNTHSLSSFDILHFTHLVSAWDYVHVNVILKS